MGGLHFRSAAELWPLVDRAFQERSRAIRTLLPHAEVEHMGATAVPGSITKGNLDLLVRVPVDGFATASTSLQGHYAIHRSHTWTTTFASFEDDSGDVPIGIQLVVAGSEEDVAFVSFRRLLREHAELVEQVNELKRSYEGGNPDAYAAAKSELYDRLLRGIR